MKKRLRKKQEQAQRLRASLLETCRAYGRELADEAIVSLVHDQYAHHGLSREDVRNRLGITPKLGADIAPFNAAMAQAAKELGATPAR